VTVLNLGRVQFQFGRSEVSEFHVSPCALTGGFHAVLGSVRVSVCVRQRVWRWRLW